MHVLTSFLVLLPLVFAKPSSANAMGKAALEPGFWFSVGSKTGGMNEGVAFGLCIAANFLSLLALEALRGRCSKKLYANAGTWGIFFILTGAGHLHAPNDASIYITVGAALQMLALTILVASRRHGLRLPLEFGILIASSLSLRVGVTTYDMGYLPNDETGDGCIQGIEAISALIILAGVLKEIQRCKQEWTRIIWRALVSIFLCFCFGYVCSGDKDYNISIGFWADRVYATAFYMEVGAWLFMLSFILQHGHHEINPTWVLPEVIQAGCRNYFWWESYRLGALKVEQEPILLQRFFPEVVLFASLTMTVSLLGMTVFTNADYLKSQSIFGDEKKMLVV